MLYLIFVGKFFDKFFMVLCIWLESLIVLEFGCWNIGIVKVGWLFNIVFSV